jgi:hypothetical protein
VSFRRTFTNVRQADGRPATGTTLDARAPRCRPSFDGDHVLRLHREVLGQTFLTVYEPTRRHPAAP